MTPLFLIGRHVVGSYFIASGLNHFMARATLVQFAAAKGVPLPAFAIPITGLPVLFAGLSILPGWRPEFGITAMICQTQPSSCWSGIHGPANVRSCGTVSNVRRFCAKVA
jgi:uncharacterized membrane protein YphA (DoxX/SURF4 family)